MISEKLIQDIQRYPNKCGFVIFDEAGRYALSRRPVGTFVEFRREENGDVFLFAQDVRRLIVRFIERS